MTSCLTFYLKPYLFFYSACSFFSGASPIFARSLIPTLNPDLIPSCNRTLNTIALKISGSGTPAARGGVRADSQGENDVRCLVQCPKIFCLSVSACPNPKPNLNPNPNPWHVVSVCPLGQLGLVLVLVLVLALVRIIFLCVL